MGASVLAWLPSSATTADASCSSIARIAANEPWALPGGWLEGGDEAIERGLERELLEETGLHARVGAVKAVEHTGFAVVLLMETELLDSTANFRASAEVSEFSGWSRWRSGSRLNARLLRRALA
jgi:8-oxo-dGTP pyrophosphatase MutT (NUDIX family)